MTPIHNHSDEVIHFHTSYAPPTPRFPIHSSLASTLSPTTSLTNNLIGVWQWVKRNLLCCFFPTRDTATTITAEEEITTTSSEETLPVEEITTTTEEIRDTCPIPKIEEGHFGDRELNKEIRALFSMRPLLGQVDANGFISPDYQLRARLYPQLAMLFNEMHTHILENRENDPDNGPFLNANFHPRTAISPHHTTFHIEDDEQFEYWNAFQFHAKGFTNIEILDRIRPYFNERLLEAHSPEGTQIRAKVHNILFLLADAVESNRLNP